MKFSRKNLVLYAITSEKYPKNDDSFFLEDIENAILGGATCVQLREKKLEENLFLKKAIKLEKLCKKHNVPLIINDNVNIALKSDADGVHLGKKDTSIKEAIKILGKNKIIGASVTNVNEAIRAQKLGASYLGVGSMFYTYSKKDADMVSISTLKSICESVNIPVLAIGGINKNNIQQLNYSGISGIAVISAIFDKNDIKSATKDLKKEVLKIINSKII